MLRYLTQQALAILFILFITSSISFANDSVTNENVLKNANKTGSGSSINDGSSINEVIKSDNMIMNNGNLGNQKTHGEYQNNTNSCASCHQTHTASSKKLLFKNGVYSTCTACHDGTLGFYNVFDTDVKMSTTGTFGGTIGGNRSVHLADNTLQIKAAPGGNLNGDGTWSSEFNCASCHSPHGSYSDRLLHYNPNSMGQKAAAEGGIGLIGEKIYEFNALPNANDNGNGKVPTEGKEILVRGTANNFGLDITDGLNPTDKVIRVYDLILGTNGEANSWVVNKSPWLYGYDIFTYSYPIPMILGYPYSYTNRLFWTRFYMGETEDYHQVLAPNNTFNYPYIVDESDESWNPNLHVEYSKGYIYATNGDNTLNHLTKGNVARAYVVKLDLLPKWDSRINDKNNDGLYQVGEEVKYGDKVITTVNQRALFAGETSKFSTNIKERWGVTPGEDVSGWGVGMSAFCSACHTDYLAKSGSATGTWNQAYRHSTQSDKFTCVRCHFAHGTDVSLMRDAQNLTVEEAATNLFGGNISTATDYMLDKNPSSALKRYTNMTVCWACHTEDKSLGLVNTDTYGNEAPRGLSKDEGTSNWLP